MEKVEVSVTIAGTRFELEASGIERLAGRATPEPLRDHFAVIAGRRFPPKQVLALATGLDRADFTTNQARAILRRAGFRTGRIGKRTDVVVPGPDKEQPEMAAQAEELRPYRGRWVALAAERVMFDADSPEEVVAWLRRNNRRADVTFRVPVDPTVDIGGFAP